MKSRRRSPFSHASAHQIEMIREAVTTVRRWELTIVKRQVPWPDFFSTNTTRGLGDISWYAEKHNAAIKRAIGRIHQREDAEQVWENINNARYQRDFPAAYEVRQLRNQLAAGSIDLAAFDAGLRRLESALKR